MKIEIKNAYANNLKNIDLSLPKNQLIAFTGVSGSGKSTLALDTIQRECQRLYMESLGMTMEVGEKAKVDLIKGLSPAISITQHQSNNNPRSSVGTITELTSYIRIVFSKIAQSENQEVNGKLTEKLTANHFSYNKPEGACPVCKGLGKISFPDIHQLVDMNKNVKDFAIQGWDQVFVDRYGKAMEQAAIHYGFEFDIELPIKAYHEVQMDLLLHGVLSEAFLQRFPTVQPPKNVLSGRFEGIVTNILRRYSQAGITPNQKKKLERFFTQQTCPECQGERWHKHALAFYIEKENIAAVLDKSIKELKIWLDHLEENLSVEERLLIETVLEKMRIKIKRFMDVGVDYLNINQPAASLSSGEWQRIKLANVIGSGLTGVLYVLDEPSAGLHARDIPKIVQMLKRLRNLGNTVLVIEHNLEMIKEVDHIVDFGPGAGQYGGQIIVSGQLNQIRCCPQSLTGQQLSEGRLTFKELPRTSQDHLLIKNADLYNLQNVTVQIPLKSFVTVTGVSGSGKTNLIFGILAEEAKNYFDKKLTSKIVTETNYVHNLKQVDHLITINHSSVGRSSRSNTATYTELFKDVREVFAQIAKQKNLDFNPKHFSTNTVGGRCEECQGTGTRSMSMHFLPDVLITCPSCKGKRYQEKILEISYHNHNISDILALSIDEAAELFKTNKKIRAKLLILQEVGLGYLGLGQATATLSGGEAQRLKLAKELMRPSQGNSLYLFDEPTTGLHQHDIQKMIRVFERLVQQGNSVIVIEHHLTVIAQSDHVIDLGPNGGKAGGQIIATGTPQELSLNKSSITGACLAKKN